MISKLAMIVTVLFMALLLVLVGEIVKDLYDKYKGK